MKFLIQLITMQQMHEILKNNSMMHNSLLRLQFHLLRKIHNEYIINNLDRVLIKPMITNQLYEKFFKKIKIKSFKKKKLFTLKLI
jgi:hypothetical protein